MAGMGATICIQTVMEKHLWKWPLGRSNGKWMLEMRARECELAHDSVLIADFSIIGFQPPTVHHCYAENQPGERQNKDSLRLNCPDRDSSLAPFKSEVTACLNWLCGHSAFYSMCTTSSFFRGKVAGVWNLQRPRKSMKVTSALPTCRHDTKLRNWDKFVTAYYNPVI